MKNIIHEEMLDFLFESHIVGGDSLRFKQAVQNVLFYNYNTFTSEFDTDIKQSNIVVTWTISLRLNSQSVEKFVIDVEKVEGYFMLQMLDLQTDELKQETAKNINDFQWKFVIDDEATLTMNQPLYIKELDFDFKNKSCIVTF
jgi:hypothetical protein